MKIEIEKLDYSKQPYADTTQSWEITCEGVDEDFVWDLCTKCLTKVDKKYNDSDRAWYESYCEFKKKDDNTYIFYVTSPYLD